MRSGRLLVPFSKRQKPTILRRPITSKSRTFHLQYVRYEWILVKDRNYNCRRDGRRDGRGEDRLDGRPDGRRDVTAVRMSHVHDRRLRLLLFTSPIYPIYQPYLLSYPLLLWMFLLYYGVLCCMSGAFCSLSGASAVFGLLCCTRELRRASRAGPRNKNKRNVPTFLNLSFNFWSFLVNLKSISCHLGLLNSYPPVASTYV